VRLRGWMRMSKKNENPLVPKLRFSEFQDSGVWSTRKFNDLIDIIEERAGTKKYTLMSVTAGIGLVSQIEKFGREIAGNAYKNYYVIQKGDFAYNKSATKQFPEGYIAMLTSHDEAALPNSIFTCFRITDENTCPKIFDHLFHVNYHGFWLRKFIAVGARAHGSLNIDTKHLLDMPVTLPLFPEQQKIADCLTSLDDLIAAEAVKLEAYKAHKKGLMQKLFPAEGETVPEWRFPEFRGKGEWKEKTIDQISRNVIAGGTPSTLETEYWDGQIRWMNSGELNLKKIYEVKGRITKVGLQNSSTKLIPKRCVLIGLAGQGKTRGTVAINMVELCTNQSIAAIYPNDTIFESNFLYHNLDHRYDELRRLSTGSEGRGGLNLQIIKSLFVNLPSIPEQQKIVDCLTSLDELITTQAKKIETFKAHKKGIMQGLFPSTDEVSV
jgi:type I restriction enzyme, S subunit